MADEEQNLTAASANLSSAEPITSAPAEWMDGGARTGLVINSLKSRRTDMLQAATQCRKAYRQAHMREPCEYLAQVYDDAADLFLSRLDQIEAARAAIAQATGEGR